MNLTLKEWILIRKALSNKVDVLTSVVGEITNEIGVDIRQSKLWRMFVENDELLLKISGHIDKLQGDRHVDTSSSN
jgi:hypothetical protein